MGVGGSDHAPDHAADHASDHAPLFRFWRNRESPETIRKKRAEEKLDSDAPVDGCWQAGKAAEARARMRCKLFRATGLTPL